MQAEAKAALEQYRAQLAEARNEAAQIRDEARAEGQQILEELRAQAQRGVGADRRPAARSSWPAQRQQVVNELRGQIGTLAVDLAGRIVGESLAEDARRRGTVDRFLAELDSMAAAGTAAPASRPRATADGGLEPGGARPSRARDDAGRGARRRASSRRRRHC